MMDLLEERYVELTSRLEELTPAERVLQEWTLIKLIELSEENVKLGIPQKPAK
jgi:hypothetical protein